MHTTVFMLFIHLVSLLSFILFFLLGRARVCLFRISINIYEIHVYIIGKLQKDFLQIEFLRRIFRGFDTR